MPVFDSNIIGAVSKLDSITDEIIASLTSETNQLDSIDSLYNSRSEFISNIEDFIANEKNKTLIKENISEWNIMMNPLRLKDEKAYDLLKKRIKGMELELKKREKQKNVLIYKENSL